MYAPNGPTLDFRMVEDRTNFIDLHNIYLEGNCRILRPNSDKLEYDAANAAATASPLFVDFTFSPLSVVLLLMASKFLLLMAITLKKLSLKQSFHTRKQKIIG